MLKTTTLLLAILLTSGCATLTRHSELAYDYDLASDSVTETKAAKLNIDKIEPNMVFVTVMNKSGKSMKVIWDESSFTDTDGNVHSLIKGTQKMITAGQSVPPSMIPVGAKISEQVTFSDNVQYLGTTWYIKPIFPCPTVGSMCEKKPNFGKTLGLTLTVEADGKKSELGFRIILKEKLLK